MSAFHVEHPDPLRRFVVGDQEFAVRRARREDVPDLVALLADDPLGAHRENVSDVGPYLAAFDAVDASPQQLLACLTTATQAVVGTLQLSFLPGLSRGGALRGQLEAVRIHRDYRRRGLGKLFIGWAIDECKARGCLMLQLASDRSRRDAHRFYHRLGFADSYVGLKLALAP